MTSLLLLKSMLITNALQQRKKPAHKKKKSNNNHTKIKRQKVTNVVLCRVCNKEKGDIPIFNNIIQPEIPEEIQNFTGVIILSTDSFSKHMCQSCLDLLNGCITFRKTCQNTNESLLEQSIKKEKCNDEELEVAETEDFYYSVPSPTYSDSSTHHWKCSCCNKVFGDLTDYNFHLLNCGRRRRRTVQKPENTPPENTPPENTAPENTPPDNAKLKFLCDTCGKISKSHAGLLQHKAIHENVFPFQCDVCPYKGRTIDLLKVHKRCHLADKPFKCTQCPKTCTTSSNLAKHMRHVHTTNRPHKCAYCDKAFSYQHDVKRHIKDIHLRQSTVDCDICFKKFNTRKILQGHRLKVHKMKGERQGRLPAYLRCQMDDAEAEADMTNEYENSENDEESMPAE